MLNENSSPKYPLAENDNSGLEPVPAQPGLERSPHSWGPQNSWQHHQQYYESGPAGGPDGLYRPATAKQRILGLSVRGFWIMVIALVLVLAGAIGGGVGGGLAAQSSSRAKESDASPTLPTTSSPAPAATDSPGTATSSRTEDGRPSSTAAASGAVSPAPTDGGCPGIDGTSYTPTDAEGEAIALRTGGPAQSFVRLCNTNYPAEAANGNPEVFDIMKLYLPSLEDCIAACALYNVKYDYNEAAGNVAARGLCRAVTVVKNPGEYCYLKNNTGHANNTFGFPSSYSTAVLTNAESVGFTQ